jgi:tetratricopeptide (TPR) repeat protein
MLTQRMRNEDLGGPLQAEQSLSAQQEAIPQAARGLHPQEGGEDGLQWYRLRCAAGEATLEEHRTMADLLFSLERYAEALDACERALALEPHDSLLLENRGTLLALSGRYEEALVSFALACEQAMEIEALMWQNYGTTLRVLGRVEASLLLYERALALRPPPDQAVIILTSKGDALLELGRAGEAVSVFDEAQRLVEQLPPALDGWPGQELLAHLASQRRRAAALL